MAVVVESRVADVSIATPKTFAVDCGVNDNRYLIVKVYQEGGAVSYPTGITYDGVAMTLLGSFGNSFSLWGLVAPSVGSDDVVITWANPPVNEGACIVAVACSDVNQSSAAGAMRTIVEHIAAAAAWSETVETVPGDYCGIFVGDWRDITHTAAGDAVERFEIDAMPVTLKNTAWYGDFTADDASATLGFTDGSVGIGCVFVLMEFIPAVPVALRRETRKSYRGQISNKI